MTKVTSAISIDWPKLKFGINAGEVCELPEDKEAQKIILTTEGVVEVKKSISK